MGIQIAMMDGMIMMLSARKDQILRSRVGIEICIALFAKRILNRISSGRITSSQRSTELEFLSSGICLRTIVC
jgi:hypothetical protein